MSRRVVVTILATAVLALTTAMVSGVLSGGNERLLGVSEAFNQMLADGCVNDLPPVPMWTGLGPVATTTIIELPGVTALASRGATAYLGTLNGQIFRWSASTRSPELLVDLSADTAVESDQGLLNLAVMPDGGSLLALRTSDNGDLVLTAHTITEDGTLAENPVELYRLSQPDPRHNGGGLAFGPNGDLFIGIGDGGGQGDPAGAASDPSNPLGSVIRAVVDLESESLMPSPRNPQDGDERDELVWATGVRNPFRIWLDGTDQLWVSDLGERCREEVTSVQSSAEGVDLGWSAYEGSAGFDADRVAGRVSLAPTVEYTHENGLCAVIGGTTYSGDIAELRGTQIIADLCTATLMAVLDGDLLRLPITLTRPIDIGIGPDGQLWVADIEVGVVRVARPDAE